MASSTILDSVSDFLSKYPPFEHFPVSVLQNIAQKSELQYFEKGEIIFEEKKKPLPHFFVVKKGCVSISQQGQLIDECDEGDLFGVRAFLAKDNYLSTARAEESVLLLSIPSAFFVDLMTQYPKVALFFAAGFASGINNSDEESTQKARNYLSKGTSGLGEGDLLRIKANKKIVTGSPQMSIHQAALLMQQHQIGSLIIVDENQHPLGIITDTDFRNKVVALEKAIKHDSVSKIMSSPVKTIKPQLTVSEIMLLMVSNRVSHFCMTQDGTALSPVVGVVSQRDLIISQGNNPAILAKEILKSRDIESIAQIRDKVEKLIMDYIDQDMAIPYVSSIITHINDVLVQKAIEISEQELQKEGYKKLTNFCWLSMGSEGRKEQILRTDLDNAIIYDETENSSATKAYFLALATKVNQILMDCGFEKCPADMMASNPKWCMSLAEWENLFGDWIEKPSNENILNTNIFFDFRPVHGSFILAERLKHFILRKIEANPIFLNFLAKSALQNPPPLSFFRKFVVEKGGEHKDRFDLKARAMMPLTDAARVLAYQFGLSTFDSSFERFEKIAQKEPNLASLAEGCAMAYEILLKIRATNGFKNKDSGRYIDPENLNKLERQTLRNIFTTIAKIQEILEVRFQLASFR